MKKVKFYLKKGFPKYWLFYFQVTQRYFSQPAEIKTDNKQEQQFSECNSEKVITYEINNIKRKPWGRRQADIHLNKVKRNIRQKPNPSPKFKGKVKPSEELLKKYDKGKGVNLKSVRTSIRRKKIEKKEKNIKFAIEKAARTEVLLTEDAG